MYRKKTSIDKLEALKYISNKDKYKRFIHYSKPSFIDQETVTFLVDKTRLLSPDDVNVDACGSWRNNGCYESYYVKTSDDSFTDVSNKNDGNAISLFVTYRTHKYSKDFKKHIFSSPDFDLVIIHYKFDGKKISKDDLLQSHGNSKNKNKPYVRSNPSVSQEIAKNPNGHLSDINTNIINKLGGTGNLQSSNQLIRNFDQLNYESTKHKKNEINDQVKAVSLMVKLIIDINKILYFHTLS